MKPGFLRLKSFLFLIAAVLVSLHLHANTNHTRTACGGGIITRDFLFAGVTMGHSTQGTWEDRAGLTFNYLPDGNFWISGFVQGQTYTLKWRRNPGTLHTFVITVPVNADPYQLRNASNNTNDVLLCSGQNHNFSISSLSGTTSGTAYAKYRRDVSTNITTHVATDLTPTYNFAYPVGSTSAYEVFAIATHTVSGTTCFSQTNGINVSAENIVLQVVGGGSVCGNPTPNITLEVIPYDVALSYTWNRDGVAIGSGSTVSTGGQAGSYTASVNACGSTLSSEPVVVTNYGLSASINPTGNIAVCTDATSLTGSGSSSSAGALDYVWLYNGFPGPGSGSGSTNTISTSNPGTYNFKVIEQSNPLCYAISPAANLNMVGFDVNTFAANGVTNFCGTITPSLDLNVVMTGSTGPITVIVSNITNSTSQSFSVSSNTTTTVTMPDLAGNAEYRITSITGGGCSAPSELLTSLSPVVYTRQPDPLVFNLTGDPGGCAGSTTIIGLSGSQTGIRYTLLRNGLPLAPSVEIDGTGAPIANAFSVSNAGVYTVSARSGSCPPVLMNGSRQVYNVPTIHNFVNTGLFCPTAEVRLDNSNTGTTYLLYRNGTGTGASRNGSTGSQVTFGNQSMPGIYTIWASTGGTCMVEMNGQLTIQAQPSIYSLSANRLSYCASAPLSGVTLTLNGSESNVNYALLRDNVVVSTIPGDGNPIQWNNQVAGLYTVRASNDGGCDIPMSGSPNITIAPLPTANIYVASATFRRCEGTAADFRLGVTLTGTAPFSFDIVNNAGLPVIQVINHPSTIFNPISVAPDQTVTYTIANLRDANNCEVVAGTGFAEFFVDPLPSITFNPENPRVCAGGAPVAITAQGAGVGGSYQWSDGLGNHQTISVSPPVTTTYSVTATTQYGCTANRPITVTVNPLPVVDFAPPGNDYSVCQNGGIIALTPVPAGGSFSGTGIIPATYNFNPGAVAPGTHNITYTYQDANTCINSITKPIVVTAPPVINISGLAGSYCANDGDVLITGTPTNNRGVFQLVGHAPGAMWNDNGNGTMNLSPSGIVNSGSGPGVYTIRYTYTDLNGCVSTMDRTTTIQEDLNDVVRFSGLPTSTCQTNAALALQAYFHRPPAPDVNITTNDGAFSGPGVTDNGNGTAGFDPSVAGNGLHTVNYNYRDPITGCRASFSQQIQVGTTISINGLTGNVFCSTDGAQSWWGSPSTGRMAIYANTFDPANLIAEKVNPSAVDPFVFTPSASTPGTYVLVYEHVDASGCSNAFIETITVEAVLNAAFNTSSGLTQFCRDASLVTLQPLTGASPGGYYSGPGVSGNTFNPAVAGVGVHTLRRTVATPTCSDVKELIVTVIGYETIYIDNLADEYCENGAGPFRIEVNNPGESGAVYTLSSTTNAIGRSPLYVVDGAGVRTYLSSHTAEVAYFDPAYVGIGSYFVTYRFDNTANNGCITVFTKRVDVVAAPDVNFGGITDPVNYCQDGGLVELEGSFVAGGFTGSGNFSGAGIDNGTPDDGRATFNPMLVTPGDHPIIYTYEHANGCLTTRTKTFTVRQSPAVYEITPKDAFGGYYCSGGTGIVIGVENSQTGVDYQLIRNLNFSTPVQTVSGTGNAIAFAAVTTSGDYTVRAVATTGGCTSLMTGVVEVRESQVAAAISTTHVTCNGGNNGAISILASGGVPPYTYRLSTDAGATFTNLPSNVISNLTAGTYHIRVVDSRGCQTPAWVPVVIGQPATALALTTSSVATGCMPCITGVDCEGRAFVTISGGIPFVDLVAYPSGYEIEWRNAANVVVGTGVSILNQPPGFYTVTVTDFNGCVASSVVEIAQNPAISLTETLASRVNILCNGSSTGVFEVVASGGATAASYQFSIDGVNWLAPNVGTTGRRFTNLPAGSYDVWVRDSNYPRCTYALPSSIVITQPTALSLNVVDTQMNLCHGNSIGRIEVLAQGGVGPYQYSINGAAWVASPLFSNLAAGIYNISVRDNNGCIFSGLPPVEITQPANPILAPVNIVQQIACHGGSDGIIRVTPFGGSAPYLYSWQRVGDPIWTSTAQQPEGLIAGTYRVRVTDANGCFVDSENVTLSQPASAITATIPVATVNHVSCNGAADGSFLVSVTPVGVYEYSIDAGVTWQASNLFSGLNAGTYNVSVRNSSGCTVFDAAQVTINELNALSVGVAVTPVTCYGENNGSAVVTVTGGELSGTVNYVLYKKNNYGVWTLSAAATKTTAPFDTHSFLTLTGGEYRVQVTDNQSCVSVYDFVVPQPDAWTVDYDVFNVSLAGGSDGRILINSVSGASGPYAFELYNHTTSVLITTQNGNATAFNGYAAGTYRVRVIATNSCYTEIIVTITQPGDLVVATTTSPVVCTGDASGSIFVTITSGTAPYIIRWQGVMPDGAPIDQTISTVNGNYTIGNLYAGNYLVTITDNEGDLVTRNVTITEPASLSLLLSANDVSCFGEGDGSIDFEIVTTRDVSIVDGYRTIWSGPGISIDNPYSNPNVRVLNDLNRGIYNVSVVDGNGCLFTSSIQIEEPEEIKVTLVAKSNLTCYNAGNGSIQVSASGRPGGTVFIYSWERYNSGPVNEDSSWDPYAGTVNQPVINTLPAGVYRVRATEAITGGCSGVSLPIIITQPDEVQLYRIGAVQHINTCNGDANGLVHLGVNGGVAPFVLRYGTVTESWNGIGAFTVSGLSAGNYLFEITDDNGCSDTHTETINEPQPLVVSNFEYGIECDDLTSAYVSFEVAGGVVVGATNSYRALLVRNENNQVYYNGLLASAVNTPLPVSLIEGSYTIHIFDANSTNSSACKFERVFEIRNVRIQADIQEPQCIGQNNGSITLNVTGGSGNFAFDWFGPDGFTATTASIISLRPGTYNVRVTDSNEGCYIEHEYIIGYQNTLLLTTSASHVTCYGGSNGSITANVIGGMAPYNYLWERFDGTSYVPLINSQTLSNQSIGTYRVVVTDSNGCQVSEEDIEITQPVDFTIDDIINVANVSCQGSANGSFTVVPSRAGNFEYSINGINWQVSPIFTNLVAGGYQVSMRDRDRATPDFCAKPNIRNVEITQPAALSLSLTSITSVDCFEGNNGAIQISPSGGTAPYSYQWYQKTSTGNIPLTIGSVNPASGLYAGEYLVRVTDDNGCFIWSDVYTVTEPASAPAITVVSNQPVTSNGGTDGSITISVTGGTPGYGITWYGTDGTTIIATNVTSVYNLTAGIYRVVITDSKNCIRDREITVSQPDNALSLNYVVTQPAPCFGAENGIIELEAAGGLPPYTFELFRYPNTPIPALTISGAYATYSNLSPGFYEAFVTDANGVVFNQRDIELNNPVPIELFLFNKSNVTCYGEQDGTITFRAEGGTGGAFEYVVLPDNGMAITGSVVAGVDMALTGLDAGLYTINVTDGAGCYLVRTFEITQPAPIVITGVVNDALCAGSSDGRIQVAISGGMGIGIPFEYRWLRDDGGMWVVIPGEESNLLRDIPAGRYKVEVTELAGASCQSESEVFVVGEPSQLVVTASPFDVNTCPGDNSGRIEVTVHGGVAPYVVNNGVQTLYGNGPSFVFNQLFAGPYAIVVTDRNGGGCQQVRNVTLGEPASALLMSDFIKGVTCLDVASESEQFNVSFTLSGGVPSSGGLYRRHIHVVNLVTSAVRTKTVEGVVSELVNLDDMTLPAGRYRMTVTDLNAPVSANCAAVVRDFELTRINVTNSIINATCQGAFNGSIELTVTGGSGNYSYSWSKTGDATFNVSTQDLSNISAGTYTVVISDVSEPSRCVLTRMYEVGNTKTLTLEYALVPVSCFGGSDGAIRITGVANAAPGVQYFWNGSSVAGSNELTGLAAGDYSVEVVDGSGCSVTGIFTVTQPASLVSFTLDSSLDCATDRRSISVENLTGGTGPFVSSSFAWSGPGTYTRSTDGRTISGITTGGVYTLKVTDARGCSTTESININGAITLSTEVGHVVCNGGNTGNIILNVSGGSSSLTYLWSRDGEPAFSRTTKDISNLAAGRYTVVVTDPSQVCSAGGVYTVTETVDVIQPSAIAVVGNITHNECAGDAAGRINLHSVTGGTAPYSFVWTTGNGSGLDITSRNQSGLTAGTYTVVVTDAKGCVSAPVSFTVNQPDPLTLTLAVDNTNCSNQNRIEIISHGGGVGPYEFIWDGPGASAGTSLLKTNLSGGTYTINMVDMGTSQRCNTSRIVELTKPLTVTASVLPETCLGSNNGVITLDVSGGTQPYSFVWAAAPGIVTSDRNQAELPAGNYNVRVLDSRTGGACHVDLNVAVPLLHNIQLQAAIDNVECFGESTGAIYLTVQNGSGNYTYQWTKGAFSASTRNITNIPAGDYTVTVTDLVFGCTMTGVYTVEQPANPIQISVVDITPNLCRNDRNGAIDISVSGGTAPYNFLWTGSGNLTASTNQNQAGLAGGNYFVTVTDAWNCVVSNFGPITVPEPATSITIDVIEVTPVTATGANNGTIQVNVSGGTGSYVILWYNEAGTLIPSLNNLTFASGLAGGNYRIEVEDANDCTAETTAYVYEPGQVLGLSIQKEHVGPCFGENNGRIFVTVTGGELPYQYIRRYSGVGIVGEVTNANSHNFSSLPAGDYTVEVRDAFGNVLTAPVRIIAPSAPLMVTANVTQQVECRGAATGVITARVSGGVPNSSGDYQLLLSGGPSGTSQTVLVKANTDYLFNNLPKGVYSVRVIDDSNVKRVPAGSITYAEGYGNGQFQLGSDCSAIQEGLIVMQPEAVVNISVEPGSEEICQGERPRLVISTSGWTFPAPLTITLNNGNSFNVTSATHVYDVATLPVNPVTTYSIVSVMSGSCSKGTGTGEAIVQMNSLPTASISGNARICAGETVRLDVVLTGVAPWRIEYNDGNGNVFVENNIMSSPHSLFVQPPVSSTYNLVSVQDRNCTGTVSGSAPVIVEESTTVGFVGTDGFNEICLGDPFTLRFGFDATSLGPWQVTYSEVRLQNGLPTGAVTQRTISVASSMLNTNREYEIDVNPANSVRYTILSIVSNGCSGTVIGLPTDILVRNKPLLPAAIVGNIEPCQGSTNIYTIPALDNVSHYVWILPDGSQVVSTNTITIPFASDASDGRLYVYGVNDCGDGPMQYIDITMLPLPDTNVLTIQGSTNLCQGAERIPFYVDAVPYADEYIWTVPDGWVVDGNGSRHILLNVPANLVSFTGVITVTPRNGCGNAATPLHHTIQVRPNPIANAGTDQLDLCADATTMSATLPAGATGFWSVVSGSALISDTERISPTANVTSISRGDVVLRWTVTSDLYGCTASDDVVVRNNQLAVYATSDHTSVCNGISVVRGTPPTSGVSGSWSVVSPVGSLAQFDSYSNAVTTVRNLAPGENRLLWTLNQNNCHSSAEVIVMNNQVPQATIDGQVSPALLDLPCGDNQIILTGNSPGLFTGRWTVAQGIGHIQNENSAVTQITNIGQGVNEFVWTITNGECSSSTSIIIRNNRLEVFAGAPRTICENQVTLDGSIHSGTGIFGEWIAPAGVILSNGTNPKATASNLRPGDNLFVWRVTKNGCVSESSVVITNNAPTQAAVGVDLRICGESTQLSGNLPVEGTGRWSIVSGSGDFGNVNQHNTLVNNVGMGDNIYRWTISKGICTSSADIKVTNRKVLVDAGKDFVTCDRIVTLSGSPVPAGMTGRWQVVSGGATIPAANIGNNIVTVGIDYGSNTFRWTITDNSVSGSPCVSFDEVTVYNNTPGNVGIIGGNRTVGSETILEALEPSGSATGYWELMSGGATIEILSNLSIRVTNLRRGENTFRWTVVNGACIDYVEVIVTNGEVIQANAGVDQVTCDNFTRLEANDPQEAIGEWSVVYGSGSFENRFDRRTRVTNLRPGDNIFRWTIRYATSFTFDDVTITNNKPDQANAGHDDIICESFTELRANTPSPGMGVGRWELIDGGGTFNPDLPQTMVTDLANGINRFRYTITKGTGPNACVSSDIVTITNGLPTPADAGVGSEVAICTDRFQLKPNTPTFGVASWALGSVGQARFEGNWVYDLAPGPNELIYRIATEHCVSEDVFVVHNNKPSDAFAGIDRNLCVDNVRLAASTPIHGTGRWERVIGAGEIANINDPASHVTGLARGANHFRWTVTRGECSSVDEVVINYNLIDANAGENEIICTNFTQLMASNPLPGEGTWGVLGGSGSANFADITDPYTTVTNLDQGDNILTWTVNHKGCVSVSQVVITNNSPTLAHAGPDQALCEPSVILAANVPVVGQGQWTIRNGGGDFALNPASTDPTMTPLTDPSAVVNNLRFGTNIFRWTIRNEDCVSYDDVVVEFNRIEADAGYPKTICASEVILEGNNPLPGVGSWSVPGGQGAALFDDPSSSTTRVRNLRRGDNTLRWTINYKGCVTHKDVIITNSLPSEAYAGNTQILCSDEAILDATNPAVGTGSWRVVTGSGLFESDIQHNTRVTQLGQGDNVFVWTTVNGLCTLEDQVLIRNDRPSEPYAGANYEEVCSNTFELKAALPDYGQGMWSIIQGGGLISEPTNPRAVINLLNQGENRLRWTVSSGNCSRFAEVVINNNTPTTANAGPDINDCKDWHVLDANTPVVGTGRWERVSGNGVFDDVTNPKSAVRNLGFGENVFRWAITNGTCVTSDIVRVFNRIPDKAYAGSDQVICENYTSLNGNDPITGTGIWRVVKGKGTFDNPGVFNTIVRDVGFGENIYRWEVAYGECHTFDEVAVVSHKTHAYAGEDQIVYEPWAVLNANNSGALGGRWSVVGTSPAVFDDADFFNTVVRNLSEGINTFRWEIDVNGCVVYDLVSIDYRVVPDAGFIVDTDAGCYPLRVRFTNYSVGGTQYLWDFGDGNTSADRNPIHTFTRPGIFTVRLIAPGPDGLDGVSTRNIIVHDHPVADFTVNPQLVYVPGDKARFYDLSTDAVSWFWDFGDGRTSIDRNPSHQYIDEGVFDVTLIVTNRHTCVDTLVVQGAIIAEPQGFVVFPNAFKPRPGSDPSVGVDPSAEYVVVFKPAYRDVDLFKMQIFNRWGQQIFETNDIDRGWDGMHDGQLAPQAVYIYHVTGQYINGREFRITGSVLLVR